MKTRSLFSGLLAMLCASCASNKPELKLAPHLDVPRYMGSWPVIGLMENRMEKNYVAETDHYEPGPKPNTIGVTFTYREKSLDAPEKTKHFKGVITDPGTNVRWKVYLFPPFGAKYQIMAISPDYQWVAIAHPSRKYGWIMSRKTTMPEAQYQQILGLFKEQGYDTSKFRKMPQPGH